MNCKPGDMAEVVRPAQAGTCRCFIGRRVSCDTFYFADDARMFWNLANPWDACEHVIHLLPRGSKMYGVEDALLKPIRPPGIEDGVRTDKPVEVLTR